MGSCFFNDTATTEIYTLSLHDALPICDAPPRGDAARMWVMSDLEPRGERRLTRREREDRAYKDRKSTRLNSSHANISYAVFCLKKKQSAKGRPLSAPSMSQVLPAELPS